MGVLALFLAKKTLSGTISLIYRIGAVTQNATIRIQINK